MSQKGLFDMSSTDPQIEPYMSQQLEENIMLRDEEVGWVREAAEGETVDTLRLLHSPPQVMLVLHQPRLGVVEDVPRAYW
ncbi:hypothetical protein CsSME_00046561 [Camellia sinensis var. sinensis]